MRNILLTIRAGGTKCNIARIRYSNLFHSFYGISAPITYTDKKNLAHNDYLLPITQ